MTQYAIKLLIATIVVLVLHSCALRPQAEATPIPPTTSPRIATRTTSPKKTTVPTKPANITPTEILTTTATAALPSAPQNIQYASVEINAQGIMEPSIISATAGVTVALTLINHQNADTLIMLDMPNTGTLALLLPGTAPITGTVLPSATPPISTTTGITSTTPIRTPPETPLATVPTTPDPTAEPTALLILRPTPLATIVSTTTARVPASPTATISPTILVSSTTTTTTTSTLTPTPPPLPAPKQIFLRFDLPGRYQIRCATTPNAGTTNPCSNITFVVSPPPLALTPPAPVAPILPLATLTLTPSVTLTNTTTLTNTDISLGGATAISTP